MRTKAVTDAQLVEIQKKLKKRDCLILQLARETGLRISDILALETAQLKPSITIIEQKTKKTRKVQISRGLLRKLKSYAASEFRKSTDKLFHITRQAVHRNVTKAAAQLGYEHIAPHSCRKAFAKDYAASHGLEATRQVLRHDSLATTLLYLADENTLIFS